MKHPAVGASALTIVVLMLVPLLVYGIGEWLINRAGKPIDSAIDTFGVGFLGILTVVAGVAFVVVLIGVVWLQLYTWLEEKAK